MPARTFVLAHLSDIHLPPTSRMPLSALNVKRALGAVNWMRYRRHVHSRTVLDAIIADLKSQGPGHIAVTGDIVNLGLVYDCHVLPLASDENARKASIRMTLTAPGCGMGEVLVEDVKTKVRQVPKVSEVEVELTFDPPWTREMMSEEAQLTAGFM